MVVAGASMRRWRLGAGGTEQTGKMFVTESSMEKLNSGMMGGVGGGDHLLSAIGLPDTQLGASLH